MRDFDRLLAEREKLAAEITTKGQTAERDKHKDIVRAASMLTSESIIKGLADLQLAFDQAIGELADTLVSEAAKLQRARRAIEIETERLQKLSNIEIAANALDILIREQQEQATAFKESSAQQREAFAQQVAAQRETWQKEHKEHERAVAAYDESLRKERGQAEADFAYKLQRSRKTEMDAYEAEKRKKELELAELEREKQKQWLGREKVLADHAREIQEYRAKIDAFPRELEEAIKRARDQAIEAATQDAQLRAELFRKEIGANKRVRELEIQTLEATIARQRDHINILSEELREALERAQDLASKAVAGTARATPSPVSETEDQ